MHNLDFALDVCVKSASCESFLELGPPHMRRFFPGVKEILNDFIGLPFYVNSMDAYSFVVFDETFKCFTSIVYSLESLNLRLNTIIASNEIDQECMHMCRVNGKRVPFERRHGDIIV
jgi:hypothetical protein